LPFLADAMLGKLARWLRILGFDTASDPSMTDDAIILRIRDEGRILLTKDSTLHKRASRSSAKSLLLKQNDIGGMLREVSPLLTDSTPGSRCPTCNTPLTPECLRRPAAIAEAKNTPHWRCPSCGKLYWHGAHWKGIKRTLVLAGLGDRIDNS
jgi:uncharacterized protein with PIN domain